jgi:hypothetical protein
MSQENAETVRRLYEALNRRELRGEELAALVSGDDGAVGPHGSVGDQTRGLEVAGEQRAVADVLAADVVVADVLAANRVVPDLTAVYRAGGDCLGRAAERHEQRQRRDHVRVREM